MTATVTAFSMLQRLLGDKALSGLEGGTVFVLESTDWGDLEVRVLATAWGRSVLSFAASESGPHICALHLVDRTLTSLWDAATATCQEHRDRNLAGWLGHLVEIGYQPRRAGES